MAHLLPFHLALRDSRPAPGVAQAATVRPAAEGMRTAAKAIATAVLLNAASAAAALAFDTSKLGQRGTLVLTDIMPLIGKSAQLQREVKEALAQGSKTQDNIICDGMRFPGQWVHLGGERASPYTCDFGGKWLRINGTVRVSGRGGRVFETITPQAMKEATTLTETDPTWKWTSEAPSD